MSADNRLNLIKLTDDEITEIAALLVYLASKEVTSTKIRNSSLQLVQRLQQEFATATKI